MFHQRSSIRSIRPPISILLLPDIIIERFSMDVSVMQSCSIFQKYQYDNLTGRLGPLGSQQIRVRVRLSLPTYERTSAAQGIWSSLVNTPHVC